jgi:hypothetical protein
VTFVFHRFGKKESGVARIAPMLREHGEAPMRGGFVGDDMGLQK